MATAVGPVLNSRKHSSGSSKNAKGNQDHAAVMNGPFIFFVLFMFLIPVGFTAVMSLVVLRPWLRANTSGVGLTVFEIIGMKLRRLDVYEIIDALILAQHSGVELSQVDVQRAAMRKLDVRKLVLAYVEAQRQKMDLTFEDLVRMEMSGELAAKLGLKSL
jgi:uncharacterized protein YqfA (UPF0365 family)